MENTKGEGPPGTTLGDVLYADGPDRTASEQEWVEIVAAMARGDQLALRALYDRMVRMVFTLSMRITSDRQAAEEVTVDVFHDVWRRASGYDPANGSVIGWVMNQTRSRALDRVRFERRKKRTNPGFEEGPESDTVEIDGTLDAARERRPLREALSELSFAERQAIEAAYFSELSHAEVATRLGEPLGTIKTRIRTGLTKLRLALTPERSDS